MFTVLMPATTWSDRSGPRHHVSGWEHPEILEMPEWFTHDLGTLWDFMPPGGGLIPTRRLHPHPS